MGNKLNIITPFLVILFGLFLLFFVDQPIPAGVCFLIGIVMIVERVWPETWESDIKE